MKNEKVLEEGGDHEMEEPRNALKGQQQLAQGSALGGEMGANQRPTGAKAFALSARPPSHGPHPGRCPGL